MKDASFANGCISFPTLFVPRMESFGVAPVLAYVAICAVSFSICLGFWWIFERHTDDLRRWLKDNSPIRASIAKSVLQDV